MIPHRLQNSWQQLQIPRNSGSGGSTKSSSVFALNVEAHAVSTTTAHWFFSDIEWVRAADLKRRPDLLPGLHLGDRPGCRGLGGTAAPPRHVVLLERLVVRQLSDSDRRSPIGVRGVL